MVPKQTKTAPHSKDGLQNAVQKKMPAWWDKDMRARVNGEIGTKDKKAMTREGALTASIWGIGVSAEIKLWRVTHGDLLVGMMCVIG